MTTIGHSTGQLPISLESRYRGCTTANAVCSRLASVLAHYGKTHQAKHALLPTSTTQHTPFGHLKIVRLDVVNSSSRVSDTADFWLAIDNKDLWSLPRKWLKKLNSKLWFFGEINQFIPFSWELGVIPIHFLSNQIDTKFWELIIQQY